MTDKDLYGGLIRLHILHHAAEEPIFGLGIIEELRHHGYEISAANDLLMVVVQLTSDSPCSRLLKVTARHGNQGIAILENSS